MRCFLPINDCKIMKSSTRYCQCVTNKQKKCGKYTGHICGSEYILSKISLSLLGILDTGVWNDRGETKDLFGLWQSSISQSGLLVISEWYSHSLLLTTLIQLIQWLIIMFHKERQKKKKAKPKSYENITCKTVLFTYYCKSMNY